MGPRRAAEVPGGRPKSIESEWVRPVDEVYPVTVPFGFIEGYPVNGGRHYGWDYPCGEGTVCYAVADGLIVEANVNRPTGYPGIQDGAWGLCVTLQVADGLLVDYCHLSQNLISVGERVGRGRMIGLTGASGLTFGDHLHLQVRQRVIAFDGTVSWPRVDPALVGLTP